MRAENGKIYINPSRQECSFSDIPVWKLYVPDNLTHDLIVQAHDPPTSSHTGIAKTLDRLKRYFYWPAMAVDVRNYINNCIICKKTKAVNVSLQPLMGKQSPVERPMQKLFMDFLGPYPRSKSGNSYLLVILDLYTKYIFLKPLRKALSSHVCEFLEKDVFMTFSVPESIVTDNASQFISSCLNLLLEKYGVTHIFTPKYSPQCNASERVNRSILSAIRAYIKDDHRAWDQHIPEITSALRNVIHSSTKFSPHFLMFGQHQIKHGSEYKLLYELDLIGETEVSINSKPIHLSLCQQLVLSNLKQAYDKNVNQYNLRSRNRNVVSGQQVLVKNFVQSDAKENFSCKLAPKFIEGTIRKKVGNAAVEITNKTGKNLGIYHLKDVRI